MVWFLCHFTGILGKRETSQEEYNLEAYDCNGPQDTEAYSILQECPEMKELASPSMLSGTKKT